MVWLTTIFPESIFSFLSSFFLSLGPPTGEARTISQLHPQPTASIFTQFWGALHLPWWLLDAMPISLGLIMPHKCLTGWILPVSDNATSDKETDIPFGPTSPSSHLPA
jgi:hypothetical protein